ncbi:MAG: copper oxidase, partial [Candidatus Eremiobacteraeota bacterium]|nr:copper oxidase [Candidatus Eremiobacteraeota bacterium]
MLLPLAILFAIVAMPMAAPNVAPPASSPQQPCALPQVGTTLLDPPNLSSSNGVLALTLTLISDSRRGSTALCW